MCRLSWNLGALTCWNPQGLFRPAERLSYCYLCSYPLMSSEICFCPFHRKNNRHHDKMLFFACKLRKTDQRVRSFLGAFAKLRKATLSFVMSVRPSVCLSVGPHGTFQRLKDGFSWNFIYQYFSKICQENESSINLLNPELNPICYLLVLLGAHHFLHVSRIRVKILTFRRLMSYIYIWSTHSWCF